MPRSQSALRMQSIFAFCKGVQGVCTEYVPQGRVALREGIIVRNAKSI